MQGEDLFPSLQRLQGQRKRGRVPFVQQTEAADCGPASLAMVLKFLGRDAMLDEVREAIGGGRDGTDAAGIIRGASHYGLVGRGLSLDVDNLRFLPAGSILHWEFNHFVVFERMTKAGAVIVDPARGTRTIPEKQLREAFTGVALVFEPGGAFEKRRAGSGRFRWYMSQVFTQTKLVTRIFVTSLLLRVFALALPLLVALVVDRVIPRSDYGLLTIVALGLGGMLVFQALTSLIRSHLFLQLRTNLDTRLTLGFVDYMSRLPFDFFQRRSAGDLMMRVNNNATVRELLTSNMLSTLLDGILVLGYLGLVVWLAPMMAAVVGALGVTQVLLFYATRRRYRELLANSLDAQARSQSYLVELFAGMATLKASSAESRAVERWSNLYVDELNVSLERGRLSAVVDAVRGFLETASPMVILGVGAVEVIRGEMTLGHMLAVNALAIALLAPLSSLVQSALQLQLLGGYMDRIDDVLAQAPEQRGDQVAKPPRLTGRVAMQGVSFRYAERAPFVVQNVTLDIRAGTTVAIVGRSGCGKSTLAGLIAGMYQPSEGKILFDGHDASRLDLRALRRQLGIVFQQPYLFQGSIRSNIALTDPAIPLDRVVGAARMACIHDDIDRMPMAYDTIIADGGSSLSGGQRQRLAIARALVHNPSILVLDEATSALDAETERRVSENLARLNCTRIVLAHRLSTIIAADMIIVLDRGEIVEAGTHHELLARGQHYRNLVAGQLRQEQGQEVAS
ncbi:MAG TPA: peptidase domain-containing ABC transporter [Kofleriaceae bacterium]|nr:peptidase domain-containing ABC transporter [Kofleriaceae bacterium]